MLNWLQEQAPRMCFALIETARFIGMGFKYSANRYMSILVRYLYTHTSQSAKINLPRSKELYSSIKHLAKEYIKLLQPELPYIKYELWKMEQFMSMPEIMLVRNRVKQTVLEVFLSKFHKSIKVDARQRSLEDRQDQVDREDPVARVDEVKVYDIYDKNARALYVVAPRAEYDSESIFRKLMWRCNCLYSLKCGLPCEHELKVVMINNSSMLDQIDERWI